MIGVINMIKGDVKMALSYYGEYCEQLTITCLIDSYVK